MPNQAKIEKVNKLRDKIADAKSIIFAEYHGLNANQVNELRSQVKEAGAEMSVAKNTLMKIALDKEKVGSKEVHEKLKGPVATFFTHEDAIAPLKALVEFAKKFELPTIKIGIIDGEVASAEKLEILSKLPSKEELLARIIGSLKSSITGFVNVLGGSQKKLVYALSAVADKKAQENA
jgi:large subunit ribosomal protein L10